MHMDILIRELRESDLPQVMAIFKEFVQHHESSDTIFEKFEAAPEMWGDYVFTTHTQEENCNALVAELDGLVVGYCLGFITEKPPIYRVKHIGEVANIGVKEGFKRQGIGEALFNTMVAWFKSNQVEHIEIEAATDNPQSVNFWRKMGGREFIKRLVIPIEPQE